MRSGETGRPGFGTAEFWQAGDTSSPAKVARHRCGAISWVVNDQTQG
jgi:hypothetical protein